MIQCFFFLFTQIDLEKQKKTILFGEKNQKSELSLS